jgi:hypothetical protein
MNNQATVNKSNPLVPFRIITAVLIVLVVIAYTAAVVAGYVPSERRIDGVNISIIVIGLVFAFFLTNPTEFSRLKLLQMFGFKLEMLEKVKEKQEEQESQLKYIMRSMLPLLLPENERAYLSCLAEHNNTPQIGTLQLRRALRRLRSLQLISMQPGQHIRAMTGDSVELAKFVRLTGLGQKWVDQIRVLDESENKDA